MSAVRLCAISLLLLFPALPAPALAQNALATLAKAAMDEATDPQAFAGDVNAEVLRLLQHPPTAEDISAIPSLAEAFPQSDPLIQDDMLTLFAHLLAHGGDHRAAIIDTATAALASPDVAVRVKALDVLGRSGDEAVIPPILDMLADPSPDVRLQALFALAPFAEDGRHPQIYPAIALLTEDADQRVGTAAQSLMQYAP